MEQEVPKSAAKTETKSADKTSHKKGKIYFINNVNTMVGQSLTEEIRNDHMLLDEKFTHTILGTRCEESTAPIPSGINKIVKKNKTRHWKKYLINSDVMVFDMLTSSFDEVQNAIHVLKTQDYTEEKVLVLISSAVTWVNTPPNKKASRINEEATDTESEVDKQADVENSGIDENGNTIFPFEETDLNARVPSPKFQSLKTLENQALAVMKLKANLKVYVLCSGVIYGNNEEAFFSHFKQAWLQKLPSLPIVGTGDNVIPTIHVKDLSNLVKRVAEVKPPHYYSFAIDRSPGLTQKELVKGISKGVGSGQTHHIELDDVIYEQWTEFLTINIRMKPSSIFNEVYLSEPEQEESHDFPWHCEKGLVENIRKVNEEFNRFHSLAPIRIAINGPPASGKTYYGSKLSEMYDIPHVKITDVVALTSKLEGESGEEIRKFIDSKKDETMEEFEKSKKKGQEINRDDIDVRLPDHHLHTLTKIKLNENVCRNRGFILDGFPKTYVAMCHSFLKKKLKPEAEEPAEEKKKPEGEGDNQPEGEVEEPPIDWDNDYDIDTDVLPKVFINLTGDLDEIKARVKELPEEKTAGSHWDDAGLDRRNGVYKENNIRAEEDFYTKYGIKVYDQNCLEEETKVTENLQQIISDNFSPASIDTPEVKQDVEVLQDYLENLGSAPEQEESKIESDKQKEEEKIQEEKAKTRLERIKEQERELLDARSQPIRQYLMDKVVPFLTEGLIKICKEMPEKPTGELADFLMKRCDERDREEREQLQNT
ncbi:unnamed protein product [Moneuplotes crassus]|uniref:Adenylate kinase 7 n=1 Tax=Euplotes crassus TaxID=5936 RepID=A0AAD2DCB3_EUPCR|nr:unnamed protein product [Moneuplotes crassus]